MNLRTVVIIIAVNTLAILLCRAEEPPNIIFLLSDDQVSWAYNSWDVLPVDAFDRWAIGIARAKAKIGMMNLTYNICRCVQLKIVVAMG